MRIGKLAFVTALGAFTAAAVDRDGRVWAESAGVIEGVVKDKASGDPVAGVTVVATSPAMKRTETAITDEQGRYKLAGLPTGTYLVTFYYADLSLEHAHVAVAAGRTTLVS